MQHDFAHLLGASELFGSADLFVEPNAFRAWVAAAALKAAGLQANGGVEGAMAMFAQRELAPRLVGDVAVIDVCGPITYKASWWSYYFGGASIEDLQVKHRTALQDPAARTLVYRFDSPGGCVTMVPEFGDEIFAARGQKPIVSVADTLIASAAYWLAAQTETIYASVSAYLGSIGVYTEHVDVSQALEQAGYKITLIKHGDHKVDGNPYEPLSDEVRARIQARVDEVGSEFEVAVARGRGVSKKDVIDTFGQGEVFRGKKAISLGMADKAGTFGQVLGRLTKGRTHVGGAAATAPGDAPMAAKEPSGCVACGRGSVCACTTQYEDGECPPDCPTCDPECPCVKKDDDAKQAVSGPANFTVLMD